MMSKDEFDGLVETSYLLSSPVNAHRPMSALQSAPRGGTFTHDPSSSP